MDYAKLHKDTINRLQQMDSCRKITGETLAWIEKQGKQKKSYDTCDSSMMDNKKSPYSEKRDFGYFEKKSADEVEPKLNVGDWITNGEYTWKIVEVKPLDYILQSQDGNIVDDTISYVDEYFRLWTIQDAKPGDILFQDLMGGMTFIFDGVNPEMAILYSFIISNDGGRLARYNIGKPNTGIGYVEENKNIIHPATKEQRELLFSKMKEVGYEWDAEKKELKKIGQKPIIWSEEDEEMLENIIDDYDDVEEHNLCDDIGKIMWLKSLKERIVG